MRTNAFKHVLAAGLAAVLALGVTGVASAKTKARDYVGVWQLDDRNGNGWDRGNGWDQQVNGGWNDRSSGRSGERHDSRQGNYDNRSDSQYQSGSRYGSRGGLRQARLPETFRIERNRGDLRLEAMNGQLLREIDFERNRQLSSQQTMYGATIYETYSLVDHGQRLMIHTTIRGSQGTREMTTVYERA